MADSVEIGISRLEMIFPMAIPVFGIPFVKSKGGKIVPKTAINIPHGSALACKCGMIVTFQHAMMSIRPPKTKN